MSKNICFAFSIHKAGSTLFYNLLRRSMFRAGELGVENALRYVSIPDDLFNAGVPEQVLANPNFRHDHNLCFDDDRTLYGGFRFVPAFATDEFLTGRKIMTLVRDPRDVLTSLYFSQQKSHRIPTGEWGLAMAEDRAKALSEEIDEFVLRQARDGLWAERFSRLGGLKGQGISWRYEDIVFDKARWLDEILHHLDVDLPASSREEFVSAEDVRPNQENAESHIRQVTPGDHRRKLKAETIDELNGIFASTLKAWDYV